MNLRDIDINLLYVLTTVLEERSATRAAQKLHVTQSAVSNALGRARELFGDPLVVRRAHGFEPTPRAVVLLPALREWVENTQGLLTDAPAFDPARSTRTFRVACADAIAATLLRPLLRVLQRCAPSTRLQLSTLDRLTADDGLARGEVDIIIGAPPTLRDGHEAEFVYRDPMECIVRVDHPKVRQRLSLSLFAELSHVELALFGVTNDAVDRALSKLGRSRTVQIALPYFSSIPLAVAETDCVATLARRLARSFSTVLPLRVLRPPIELDPIEIRQVWHHRSDSDGAVKFLRGAVREAAKHSAKPRC